ncbi:MAG: CHAT domain-containing protein [candidate division KSB1 bacterium]|nr:CHAT domain-containing protein [candidate division KSB1 bacterium]MDZ7274034.1 CHAT domain-containing protein [candidate division KSB1 bacterium]MDZ7286407.1 CHAT domain-containing protein [candidate division KSB1 bacterium]MDZ7296635.1 CHAT domain-containing protein [candidate division KSB1 bacterium]MDZ7306857.1 CHAT domain-containing protein [candidate division KSB1 bacterium]
MNRDTLSFFNRVAQCLRRAPRVALPLAAGMVIWLSHASHHATASPLPLQRETIAATLSKTPFDLYQLELQQRLLAHGARGHVDSIRQIVELHPYHAGVIFHHFLERSLFLHFNQQPDSARLLESVARLLAQDLAQVQSDSFFIKRFQRLTVLQQSQPRALQGWVAAQAVFMRGIRLDSTNVPFNLQCLDYAYRRFLHLADYKQVADNLWWLCIYFFRVLHDDGRALGIAQQWCALSRDMGYRDGELQASLLLAEIYENRRNTDSASVCFNLAAERAQQLGNPYALARLLDIRLLRAIERNEFPEAIALLRRLLQFSRAIKFRALEGIAHASAARVYHMLADYDQALAHLDSSIVHVQQLNHRVDLPPLLLHQADIFLELGERQRALVLADSALGMYLAQDRIPDAARTHGLIGLIHLGMRDFVRARAAQERGLNMLVKGQAREVEMELWNNLGEIALQQERAGEAKQVFTRAIELWQVAGSDRELSRARVGLARAALALREYGQARRLFEEELARSEATHERDLAWKCHLGLARVYEALRATGAAEQHYSQAITALENIRDTVGRVDFNMSYFSTVQEVFDAAILFALVVAKNPGLALAFMEKARARNIVDLLRRQQVRVSLAAATRRDSALVILQPNPAALQLLLDEATAVVAYRVMRRHLIIVVLDRTRYDLVCQPLEQTTLRQAVQRFRSVLGVDDLKAFHRRWRRETQALWQETRQAGATLYRQLVAPVAGRLAHARTIYFIPDDVLHYLPFAAFSDGQDGRFLIEKHAIATAPSLTALQLILQRTQPFVWQPPDSLLAIALRSRTIPLAAQEVDTIAGLFANARSLVHERWTRPALLARLHGFQGIVHLAMHAEVDDSQPLQSYLLLDERHRQLLVTRREAGGESVQIMRRDHPARSWDDDTLHVLRAADVLSLDAAGLKLVVLSACNTALGRQISGEGMMGLAQAFLCAGTQRLLTTLWQVDDQSTYELMPRFYRPLAQGVAPAAALQAAQIETIRRLEKGGGYALPYFWAAFVLTGRAD